MKKNYVIIIAIFVVIIFTLGFNQWLILRKAHSTFDNYYAFRGCVRLIEKKDNYGICQTDSSQTIKIVKYQDKWYLDGDLPWACIDKLCFGI